VRPAPFPAPGPDGDEPDGPWPDDDRGDPGEAPAQGLYVCLPAEQVTLAGFAEGGAADTMTPGALLAAVVEAVTGDDGAGLAGLSDDQLFGIISAARRMESRAAWTLMAAVREFAARRPARQDRAAAGLDEFAADELAAELLLTRQSAAGQIAYACAVADRLPCTFAALAAGQIHPVHVRIIDDETSVLLPADAAHADAILAEKAGSLTFGQLRSHAHRLILQLDPDAAARRKETAKQDTHVRRFREDSGNAGMVARELPSDEVLASWQHVEQRALDLRAAGLPGTLQELRVRAYLDLLQERDSRAAPAAPDPDGQPAAAGGPGDPSGSTGGPGGTSSAGPHGENGPGGSGHSGGPGRPGGTSSAGPHGENGPGGSGHSGGPGRPGGTSSVGPHGEDGSGHGDGPGGRGPGSGPQPDAPSGPGGTVGAAAESGPAVAALVNLTVPWSTATGQSEIPGEAGGFGLLDAQSVRDLIAAAARHPRTRWCLTVLAPDGTAAAHGCLPGTRAGPAPGARPGPGPRPAPGPLPWTIGPQAAQVLGALGLRLHPVIRGPCDHAQAEPRYRPGRLLQHLITTRNTRCTAPGCGQPAARCDLDHTRPWQHGGATCPCNLAPLCRHHHRCKQAEGWQLEQPEPGVLVWRTPARRTYTVTPTQYPA
jgi:Domain of unknown function (DUF222)